MGRSIKQIVPSILGVGSAFQIITKAAQTFMQNNEQITQRMGAAWTSLGNLIGPIIEKVVGWVTTAIQYLTAFLKLLGLTGTSSTQTGKATEKAAASAKKGVEDLRRTLLGFDELNVLADNNSSSQDQSGTAGDDQKNKPLAEIQPPEWMTHLADLLKGGQFEEFGRELARMLNKAIASVDWADLGRKVSNFFLGVLQALYGAIDEFDFRQLGQSIKAFFLAIDWAEIRQTVFELLKSAWKGAVNLLWGFMADDDSAEAPPLIKSLQRLGDSLADLYKAIDDFVQMAWESELKPVLEWTIDTGLPWLIDRLSDGIDFLAQLIENHGPLILTILQAIGAAVLTFKIGEKVEALVGKVSALWAVLAAHPILAIVAAVAALVVVIVQYGDQIKEKLQELDAYLQGVFVKDWRETFGPVLGGILNGFFKIVKEMWDRVKTTLDGIIDFIKGVFSGDWERAWTGISEILSGIFGTLYDTFAELVSKIVQHGDEIKAGFQAITDFLKGTFAQDWTEVFGPVLGGVLNGFFETVSRIWESVQTILDGVIDFIQGTFSGNWAQAWQGVREVFEGIFSGLEYILKAPLNGIISLINGAIAGINHLIDGANALGSVVGFSIPYLNEIPYLAKGGVLKRGQVGLLEGDGAEAVVPLEKNTEWISKVSDQFLEQLAPPLEMRYLSALQNIADTISFKAPPIAQGTVMPYSVQAATAQTVGGDQSAAPDLLAVLERIEERLNDMQFEMNHLQFIAQFGDLRALARKITKEQRRETISRGD